MCVGKRSSVVPWRMNVGQIRSLWKYSGMYHTFVLRKAYARALIDCVVESTEMEIRKEKFGFKKDMCCSGQIFEVRKLCEKMKEKRRVA